MSHSTNPISIEEVHLQSKVAAAHTSDTRETTLMALELPQTDGVKDKSIARIRFRDALTGTSSSSSAIDFQTATVEDEKETAHHTMTLTGGQVGIGTKTPQSLLDVQGDVRFKNTSFKTSLEERFLKIGQSLNGSIVSLSDDGNNIAVGYPSYDNEKGKVEVYEWVDGLWQQKGQSILGGIIDEQLGHAVTLSGDGDTLAISTLNDAFPLALTSDTSNPFFFVSQSSFFSEEGFRAFDNNKFTFWHSAIDGYNTETGVYIGGVVTTANTGTIFGDWIQWQLSSPTAFSQFRIYPRLDSNTTNYRSPHTFTLLGSLNGTTWTYLNRYTDQNGWDANGKVYSTGSSVAYTYYRIVVERVGDVAVTGSLTGIRKDSVQIAQIEFYSGSTSVYRWDSSTSLWTPKGSILYAEQIGDQTGTTIDLSTDGNLLTLSATGYDTNATTDVGQVRVYQWTGMGWNSIEGTLEPQVHIHFVRTYSQFLQLNESSVMGDTFTIATRFRFYGTVGNYERVFETSTTLGNGYNIIMTRNLSENRLWVIVRDTTSGIVDQFSYMFDISQDTWYDVVLQYDGNTFFLYVNDMNTTVTLPVDYSGYPNITRQYTFIGRSAFSGNDYANLDLAGLLIYRNTVLNASQRVAVFATLTGNQEYTLSDFPLPSAITYASLPFQEDSSTVTYFTNTNFFLLPSLIYRTPTHSIQGTVAGEQLGRSLGLSGDGLTLAVGSPATSIYVYEWNELNTEWDTKGAPITESVDGFGYTLSLSADGTTIAVGAIGNESVYVYEWNSSAWTQKGSVLLEEANGDQFGYSVSLSDTGVSLIVSAPSHNSLKGKVYVYRYVTDDWVLVQAKEGGVAGERLGESLSISGEAERWATSFDTSYALTYESVTESLDLGVGIHDQTLRLLDNGAIEIDTDVHVQNQLVFGKTSVYDSGYGLKVDGDLRTSVLYVGEPTGSGTIYMGGGDPGDGDYNHSVIETRTYSGDEKTELLLFKGNDPLKDTVSGTDRIRLRAGEIQFDVYDDYSVDRNAENIRMTINSNGNVGIGINNPVSPLDILNNNGIAIGGSTLRLRAGNGATLDAGPQIDFMISSAANEDKFVGAAIKSLNVYLAAEGHAASLAFYTRPNPLTATLIERMRITHDGNVGIGTNNPARRLHVDGGGITNNGIYITNAPASDAGSITFFADKPNNSILMPMIGNLQDIIIYFKNNTGQTKKYYMVQGVLTFTGQHLNYVSSESSIQVQDHEGLIVVSTGTYQSYDKNTRSVLPNHMSINECLPYIALSSKAKQKSVFGVITCYPNEPIHDDDGNIVKDYTEYPFERDIGGRVRVNSLGEGGIWVCDINGNLENGDYITSSIVPGYGMKQDEEMLMNYTVAKITCDCDFSNLPSWIRQRTITHDTIEYKAAFVGCTYHCG